MNDALQSLEAITRMMLDTELARLRRLSDEVTERTDEIGRLTAEQATRARNLAGAGAGEDPAFTSGRDAVWQAWLAEKRLRLSQDAAEAAARREAQRLVAERAFGRVEALARIRASRDEARRLLAARRTQT